MWFSISKSGDKGLDRVGKSSARAFRLVAAKQVMHFLHFNMHGNTLLVSGQVLLEQGQRGVPIGEFLSAQLAEIWAAWREYTRLFANNDETRAFETQVSQALSEVFTCSAPSPFSDAPTEQALCMKCCTESTHFCLATDSDFPLAPVQAAGMVPHGPILRVGDVHIATMEWGLMVCGLLLTCPSPTWTLQAL